MICFLQWKWPQTHALERRQRRGKAGRRCKAVMKPNWQDEEFLWSAKASFGIWISRLRTCPDSSPSIDFIGQGIMTNSEQESCRKSGNIMWMFDMSLTHMCTTYTAVTLIEIKPDRPRLREEPGSDFQVTLSELYDRLCRGDLQQGGETDRKEHSGHLYRFAVHPDLYYHRPMSIGS